MKVNSSNSSLLTQLDEVVSIDNGYAFKSDEFVQNGTPIIRIGNIVDGNIEIDYNIGYDTKNKNYEKYLIKNQDILIAMSGATTGKLAMYRSNNDALLNQRVGRFKVIDEDILDNNYLYYYLRSDSVQNKIKVMASGCAQPNISSKQLLSINIPILSLETQKKIVEILEKAERVLEKRKETIKLLDDLVKSRFIEMFGDPVANTMNWNMKTLFEVGSIGRGVSKHRPRNAPELLGGDYPLIQTGDVANAGLYIKDFDATYSELGLKQSKLWQKGTLCITIAANIAKTGILTFDACFPDSVVGFIAGEKTNNIFMYYWFSSFQKLLEEQAPESAQKNINLKILGDLKVIVPPIQLQNQFADFVKQIDKLKFEMESSLKEVEDNFNSLMQKAFIGELFN